MNTPNFRVVALSICTGVAGFALGMFYSERSKKVEVVSVDRAPGKAELQIRIAELEEKVRKAETYAEEAEKDAGALLKAVETSRADQAARAAVEKVRIGYERAFQQDLARRRAAEADFKKKIADEISGLDSNRKFKRLIEVATECASKGEFQSGMKVFNEAMGVRPPESPITDDIRNLQLALLAESQPVDISLRSEGDTFMMIAGYRVLGSGYPGLKLPPGNYEIVGVRQGYQEVRIPVQLRSEGPKPVISVSCNVPSN